MATSSTSIGLRLPAAYPHNQTFPAVQGNILTNTETQPSVSASARAIKGIRPERTRQSLSTKRTIQVQTKVFRTDQDSGASDFSSCYTSVSEDKL